MLPATVGLVYWKMITYCVPNDKSAQRHVAPLSSPDPSLIVSTVSFLCPALALICWNDSPHIRGTNRMPSASLSLSSPYPHSHPNPQQPPHPPTPLMGKSSKRRARGGANVVRGQGSVLTQSTHCTNDIMAARNHHMSSNTFWVIILLMQTGGIVRFNTTHTMTIWQLELRS